MPKHWSQLQTYSWDRSPQVGTKSASHLQWLGCSCTGKLTQKCVALWSDSASVSKSQFYNLMRREGCRFLQFHYLTHSWQCSPVPAAPPTQATCGLMARPWWALHLTWVRRCSRYSPAHTGAGYTCAAERSPCSPSQIMLQRQRKGGKNSDDMSQPQISNKGDKFSLLQAQDFCHI